MKPETILTRYFLLHLFHVIGLVISCACILWDQSQLVAGWLHWQLAAPHFLSTAHRLTVPRAGTIASHTRCESWFPSRNVNATLCQVRQSIHNVRRPLCPVSSGTQIRSPASQSVEAEIQN